jgi:hypothetical protein
MSDISVKPIIFISYSHKDEPEKPRGGEVQWLSFVRTYLQPAIKHGIFDLFVDEHISGGANLKPEIERSLHACDVFILLISPNSTASDYIVDTEIKITRDREANGENVVFYPLLLTPTPKVALDKFKDKMIRPRDATPLSSFPYSERIQQMTDIADEIASVAADIASRKPKPPTRAPQPAFVHITGLPETAYQRLVGRDADLKRLDDGWADAKTNILSLVAEGGAGKSALVNEWLKRMQADNYRGAEAVLGWSFYSQGTKERATSAEEFLKWALDRLGVDLVTTSAIARADAIAEAMMRRRVLLLLDGVEPLQHGLDTQLGLLKDFGLRALLRRFAATPPGAIHGLVVLTSRLAVKDIGRWHDSSAPVVDVERLPDDAGAALLRDNGVWGIDKELKAAAQNFGGHPLALGLLASFLKETQVGDVRRRDHIRTYFVDPDNPRHDHARRVMESYENEWFFFLLPKKPIWLLMRFFQTVPKVPRRPIELAIMHLVGLFDRPASGDCLMALRAEPAIKGLTDQIVELDDREWQRAITRLREVQLLAPPDPAAAETLDAHPLVREWFGERLRRTNNAAWSAAHGRLYEYLRDTTIEGGEPTLENLAPLYQAIAHGCRAGRYQETLDQIYRDRICRHRPNNSIEFYAFKMLGAVGTNLAAVSWFFNQPYRLPTSELSEIAQSWVLGEAAACLRGQGRFIEAREAEAMALRYDENCNDSYNATISASNLSQTELLMGDICAAVANAKKAVMYADGCQNRFWIMGARTTLADAEHAAGRRDNAKDLFLEAEQHGDSLRYSLQAYRYFDFLLSTGMSVAARDRVPQTATGDEGRHSLFSSAIESLALVRILVADAINFADRLRLLKKNSAFKKIPFGGEYTVETIMDEAKHKIEHLEDELRQSVISAKRRLAAAKSVFERAERLDQLPRILLAGTGFHRACGNWTDSRHDLDDVFEIAELGSMRLFLCDTALESARLAFAQIEAFAPLNGLADDSPPKPVAPDTAEAGLLKDEATKQLGIASDYIKTCGYHRRDEELSELQAVLCGERKFADLPPRV